MAKSEDENQSWCPDAGSYFTAFFAPFYNLNGCLASEHMHFYFVYYLLTKYSLISFNGVLNFFGGFSLDYSALFIVLLLFNSHNSTFFPPLVYQLQYKFF